MSIPVQNWGKFPTTSAEIHQYRPGNDLPSSVWIPRGAGRCYGDASLHSTVLSSQKLQRFLDFDPIEGTICLESGINFQDLIQLVLPYGWFPPVTPGTQYVTMGGALASDVHGKNHHLAGSFSQYVRSFRLLMADGSLVNCSPETNSDLFWATAGGQGLTGLIVDVSLQLQPIDSPYIQTQHLPARNLDEIMDLFTIYEHVPYSVAWLDCLARGKSMGRSILMLGTQAAGGNTRSLVFSRDKIKLSIPFDLPTFILNPLSIRLFNQFYYFIQSQKSNSYLVPLTDFFYPLDKIRHWNRMYGKKGFLQYQFVVPPVNSRSSIEKILSLIEKSGERPFLAVLKRMGRESKGLLSFPMEGFTLAMDFPISKGIFNLLDRLDEIVVDFGGRVYLTKDARLQARHVPVMYPSIEEFRRILQETGAYNSIRSDLSLRLGIHV